MGNSGVLAGVGGLGGSDRGNRGAVDGGLGLAGGLLDLRGLGSLDDGGGVGRNGQSGGLGDRVGLLLVGDNGRSGADEGGLLDDLGGSDRVLDVLNAGRSDGVALRVDRGGGNVASAGADRVLVVLSAAGGNGVSRNGAGDVGGSRSSVGRSGNLINGSR